MVGSRVPVQLRSRRSTAWTCLLAAVLLAGCGIANPFAPSDETLMRTVSLTQKDAAADATFAPYENGDVVAGEDSLDLCYASFPSERLRIGRHQVAITANSSSDDYVSSEAILYSSPAEAEQAMGELKAAEANCPEQATPLADRPDVSVKWTFGAPPDAGWPEHEGVTRQAYAFTVSVPDSDFTSQGTAVYLQRGRMILALYSNPPSIPAKVIVNAPDPERFTEVMTQRLLVLPEESLQQGDSAKRQEDPRDIGT